MVARYLVLPALAAGCLALAACSGGSGGSTSAGVTPGNQDNRAGPGVDAQGRRTRYALNNQCFAVRASNGKYLVRKGGGFVASAARADDAEPFFFKPTALGKYMLFDAQSRLLQASGSAVRTTSLANASDAVEFTVIGVGDTTDYPPTPRIWVPPASPLPTVEELDTYRNFQDPNLHFHEFTLRTTPDGPRLAAKNDGTLFVGVAGDAAAQGFAFAPVSGCAEFPEASSNTVGESFSGTQPDGSVLGMADVHVHISATEFLGGAEWGDPFSKFGVTHALGDGASRHGPHGTLDVLGALYVGDYDGHDTAGWPTFPDWPAYGNLTHEAIYYKWLKRGWKAGLRIAVNDVVENQTLCELERNVTLEPGRDCNSMNNAIRQIGTMYAMQDYIDAQNGGHGAGWFQIVLNPTQARQVIENGKLAVVLGIEISNLFNCQVNYNPLRTQEPYQETGTGLLENHYRCTQEEGKPNSVLTQLNHLKALGVRQMITIHEFDNAFGGNGIFNDLILNVGNRENSGGIPSGNLANITNLLNSPLVRKLRDPSSPDPQDYLDLGPQALNAIGDTLDDLDQNGLELPTGEFWTTYNCPVEDKTQDFSGYLFGSHGGAKLQGLGLAGACPFTGQGGRPGGSTPCYPAANQCNARWMTPIGLYTYKKLMEAGMIVDFDHLELEMKSQLLDLAEAQTPAYPIVSTHGTFGGTSNEDAIRVLRDGGFIYPSLGNGHEHLAKMAELRGIYQQAMADVPEGQRPLFGFGFGTDTDGLSAQAPPRKDIPEGKAVTYPYTLFSGSGFDQVPGFNNVKGVVFDQPCTKAPDGRGRCWSLDQDGSAQYGMLSGMVQELRLEGDPQDIRDLYNSAERYLRTWERTLDASNAINANGIVTPDGILRPAPKPKSLGVGFP